MFYHVDLNLAATDVKNIRSKIQSKETETPQQGNKCPLELKSCITLQQHFTVSEANQCRHISCATSERVWVQGQCNLIFTNTAGEILHHLDGVCRYGDGSHTINSENELFYINENYDIKKTSQDSSMTITFLKTKEHSEWTPWCVYCSLSTGDLLVGMTKSRPLEGIVIRLNQKGRLIQIIQHDSDELEQHFNKNVTLYRHPLFITENNNKDVVVSDRDRAVVVTSREGKHRFNYTGILPGSAFHPQGICTDALSHILVCNNQTVQMLDKDGKFLSHLLIRPAGIFSPQSLSYDFNTHRLWVGTCFNNTLCVYNYIKRKGAKTSKYA